MKRWQKWSLMTLVFYLLFLIWHLPAKLCWQWAAPRLGSSAARVKVADISGSWTSGQLDTLQSGPLRLNNLTWSLRPLGLVAGQLRFALTAKLLGKAPLSTTLVLSPRRLGLRNLHVEVPAALLGESLLPGLGLSGLLNARNLDLEMRQGRLAAAEGNLSWQKAAVSFPEPVKLGTLSLELATKAGDVVATLKDGGGPLSINVLARLKPDGSYQLTGQLLPRGRPEPKLASLLQLFGKPAADGRILLRREGRLAALF